MILKMATKKGKFGLFGLSGLSGLSGFLGFEGSIEIFGNYLENVGHLSPTSPKTRPILEWGRRGAFSGFRLCARHVTLLDRSRATTGGGV